MSASKDQRFSYHSKIRQSIGIFCMQYWCKRSCAFSPPSPIPFPSAHSHAHFPCHSRGLCATSVSWRNELRANTSSSSDSSRTSNPTVILGQRKPKRKIRNGTKSRSVTKRKVSNRRDTGAWYQRDEMMQHEILTKESENDLGNKIVLAKKVRDEMISVIEQAELEKAEFDSYEGSYFEDIDSISTWENDDDDDFGYMPINMDSDVYGIPETPSMEYWQDSLESFNFQGDRRISSTLVQDGSKLSMSSIEADLCRIKERDVIEKMKIPGGKNELQRILLTGADARTKLMKANIRLVVSISKKWLGRNASMRNKNGSSGMNGQSGGWDTPSLDEVIQEGVLGLARAVDKFDPKRGLRFSTYSTHWITSYVRQCFQDASTGCLKIPAQLHEIKSSYKSLIRQYVEASEPLPTEEVIASQIGVSVNRLRTAIRVTESLLSIDEPIYSGGTAVYKGSGAGGDNTGERTLVLMDRLQSNDIAPEEFVELSFLRQTLENAMATELSPHERDILRLRLGLDDGQSRSVKQVVDECGGGITVADVRSAERRAFKKLRSPTSMHAHHLIEYLDIIGVDLDLKR